MIKGVAPVEMIKGVAPVECFSERAAVRFFPCTGTGMPNRHCRWRPRLYSGLVRARYGV